MTEPKRFRMPPTDAEQYQSYKRSVHYDKAYAAGVRAGMERAAKIANINGYHSTAEVIRKEIDNG